MEPLNKINVLDKGYVALVSVSNDGKTLKGLYDEYFRTKINRELWHLASMTLLVKCPLFKQLHLSKSDLKIVQLPETGELETYCPDVSDISTGNSKDDSDMAEYLKQTTESLLIAPKALQEDKCNKFVSQIITPISVYNKIIVHGSLNDWLKYIKQQKLPKQLESYRAVIEGIMAAEWKQLDTYKKGI
jgi:hypothetical protein